MFHMDGRSADGKRVVFIGIGGSELGGIRNSGMALTLDGVRGPPLELAGTDYLVIVRADSMEALRGIATRAKITIEHMYGLTPGIIEKPRGGLD